MGRWGAGGSGGRLSRPYLVCGVHGSARCLCVCCASACARCHRHTCRQTEGGSARLIRGCWLSLADPRGPFTSCQSRGPPRGGQAAAPGWGLSICTAPDWGEAQQGAGLRGERPGCYWMLRRRQEGREGRERGGVFIKAAANPRETERD